ncbi:type VI secretion system baseplate subunit TssK [Beijerinckia mobilis]|uniref:type VI secretion system baseplate subunit TssK n=1 Tax=Beijerinckia mobilis TaxID=231434 RepID=UPI000551535F|nr:type VI secretion system baseplate subunit TssK [Beijerinckia mobilis]
MSWRSKVVWSEGLFLRPHHLQQNDRYLEWVTASRTRRITPFAWGFSRLEIDHALAQRGKFGLEAAWGVMPDGTPFELEGKEELPEPLPIDDKIANRIVWLSFPESSPNTCEVTRRAAVSASRFFPVSETFIDSTSEMRSEEEIEIAHPRMELNVETMPKRGYNNLALARIQKLENGAILLDQEFAPSVLVCGAHSVTVGWINRVIGWVDNKLEELARYAADPTAGGGLQNRDYLVLQVLNRAIPVLEHFEQTANHLHPERLYVFLVSLAGELATFCTDTRRAPRYRAYDHEHLKDSFEPVLRDLQDYLSKGFEYRAIRLELIQLAANAFKSPIKDRSLFQNASFYLEVASLRPLAEIQLQFPNLLKLGPDTRMNEIVHFNLPGVPLVHRPTPPPQIRALGDHVYFYIDKKSPLWAEFSVAGAIGIHFSGDWPDLELDLWAIREDRR